MISIKCVRDFTTGFKSRIVLCATAVWIGFSSVTQVANKKVLSDGNSVWTLLCLQMLCGSLVHLMSLLNSNRQMNCQTAIDSPTDSWKSQIWLILVGFCNSLAHLLTYYAMQMITPALTHVIRGTEPIWTMVISYVMLQKRSSFYEVISITLMILGVMSIAGGDAGQIQQHSTFIEGIMITIFANVIIAIRNCGSKRYSLLTSKELHYPTVCAYSFAWIIIPSSIQTFLHPTNTISIYFLIAAVFHVLYSTMSFYILSLMEPTSHSIIKLISRTVAVLSLTYVYGIEEPTIPMVFGIFLCIVGACFYYCSTANINMKNGVLIKTVILTLLIACFNLTCLYTYTSQSNVLMKELTKSKVGTTHNVIIQQLRLEALKEVGIYDTFDDSTIQFPIIPTSGYRKCLNGSDVLNHARRNGPMLYIGNVDGNCKGCTHLHMSQPFSLLSNSVCNTNAVFCGIGSSFLCGLLAMSTKTVVYVDFQELHSWPPYMSDFIYGTTAVSEIEQNHRLVFDRHTLKQSNKDLLNTLKTHGKSENGFNLLLYQSKTRIMCNKKTNKTRPLPTGNMGDIFGSYLAEYYRTKVNMNYSIICYDKHSPDTALYNLTFALVGSIARRALETRNTVLLGVGTIKEDALLPKIHLRSDVHVIGVRGPRTRDAFLSKYAINPEIVGDPGLYFHEVFREEIQEERNKEQHMKDLCFLSHEVENQVFAKLFQNYRNITISAGGKIKPIITFLSQCRAVVTSSLHGVIFSHSLSIPVAAVKVSNQIIGGDWKFYDYYYGIKLTSFTGRIDLIKGTILPQNKQEWIELVNKFPQPAFPLNVDEIGTFKIFKSILQNGKD